MPAGDRVGVRADTRAGVAAGWSVLLPDNWYHFPLDAGRQRRVAAMLQRVFASQSRDTVYRWRRELEQQINTLLDNALAEGGSDVYLLVDPRYGLPLGATGLASLVPIPLPADVPGEILAQTLATRPGDTPFTLLVEGQECAAIHREESSLIGDDGQPAGPAAPDPAPDPAPDAAPDPAPDAAPDPAPDASADGSTPGPAKLTVTCLDVFVPFPSPAGPGSERMLLLSFRTPVAAVAGPMMALFEAIAESLRWKWE